MGSGFSGSRFRGFGVAAAPTEPSDGATDETTGFAGSTGVTTSSKLLDLSARREPPVDPPGYRHVC